MVFQNYALYPHMSVADNMGFALKIAGESKDEIDKRVKEAAKILDLDQYLDRKPKALSGGQRQRVAMGRAIVRSPQVFLMDEPLSNLDAKLRVQTRSQIAALQRRLGVTTVYVTHDQVEAMTMGDRVAVLKDGILQQCDTPRNMYDNPKNVFVAGFIGSPAMNLFEVSVDGGSIQFGTAKLPVPRETAAEADKSGHKVTIGVRPEDMDLTDHEHGLQTTVEPGRGARRRRLRLRHRRPQRRGARHHRPGGRPQAASQGRDGRVRSQARPRAPVLDRHRRASELLTWSCPTPVRCIRRDHSRRRERGRTGVVACPVREDRAMASDDDSSWVRPVLTGVVALVVVSLLVGGVVGAVVLGAARMSGIGEGRVAASAAPSLYLPSERPTTSPRRSRTRPAPARRGDASSPSGRGVEEGEEARAADPSEVPAEAGPQRRADRPLRGLPRRRRAPPSRCSASSRAGPTSR